MQSIDGLLTYRQAHSIAFSGSLQLNPPIWWGQLWTTSKFGIGLSLLYLPGLFIFSWLRPDVPLQHGAVYDFRLLYADPLYAVAAAPIQIIATAATALLVALVIRELGFGRRLGLFGLVLYGVGSPALVYSRSDFTQPLTALCWIAAFYAGLRVLRGGGPWSLAAVAAAVFYAVLTRQVDGALLFGALAMLLAGGPFFWRWRAAEWRGIAVLSAALGAAVAITLLVDWGRSGSPFVTGYEGTGWTTPLPIGLAGAIMSPGRGLLWEFPAVILVPLGAWRLVKGGRPLEAAVLGGLAFAELLNVAAWEAWWGGWDWGLRLFLPALPLLAVLAGIGVAGLRGKVRLLLPAFVLLAGIVWALPGVVTDLLGGYASTYDGTTQSFAWSAYPPLGAWRFLHHIRASSIADTGAVDIVWVRLANATHSLSLVPGAVLFILAALLGRRALKLERESAED